VLHNVIFTGNARPASIKMRPTRFLSFAKMPRTGIEQSQIFPRNQAIPQKALQKALQSIQN